MKNMSTTPRTVMLYRILFTVRSQIEILALSGNAAYGSSTNRYSPTVQFKYNRFYIMSLQSQRENKMGFLFNKTFHGCHDVNFE